MNKERAVAQNDYVSSNQEKKGLSISQSPVSLEKKEVIDKKQNEGHGVDPLCLLSFTLSLCSHFQR